VVVSWLEPTEEEIRVVVTKAAAWDLLMRLFQNTADGKSGPIAQPFGKLFLKHAGEALDMASAAAKRVEETDR
jgi:hypothetical protein